MGYEAEQWRNEEDYLNQAVRMIFCKSEIGRPCLQGPSSWRTVLPYYARNGIAFSLLTPSFGVY